jgi:hypothetical protein
MADSDYIAYVDESGDHSLRSINPQYPIFVVAFCIVHKAQYSIAVNDLLARKFSTFGHNRIVLHEREIRKRSGEFAFLNDSARRQKFFERGPRIRSKSAFHLGRDHHSKVRVARAASATGKSVRPGAGVLSRRDLRFFAERGSGESANPHHLRESRNEGG